MSVECTLKLAPGDSFIWPKIITILVHKFVPLKALLGFATMTREARDEVQAKLLERGVELPVAVRRAWYY